MFKKPLKWLRHHWWGLIIAHFLLIISTYLVIWQLAEPVGIPDTIDALPNFARSRFFFHLVLTLLISSYLTLVLDLILRRNQWNSQASSQELVLLERIGFESGDTLMDSCWHIPKDVDPQPIFKRIDDGFIGKALDIRSAVTYAADYYVLTHARLGELVEFIVRLDRNGIVYARIEILSRENTPAPRLVWLKFQVGVEKPRPHEREDSEWIFPIQPIHLEGGWIKFRVNLKEAVEQTFGTRGWRFGHIRAFRLRGSFSIARISIFTSRGTLANSAI